MKKNFNKLKELLPEAFTEEEKYEFTCPADSSFGMRKKFCLCAAFR